MFDVLGMSFGMTSGKLQLSFIHINLIYTMRKCISRYLTPKQCFSFALLKTQCRDKGWEKEAQKIDIVWTFETGHKEL